MCDFFESYRTLSLDAQIFLLLIAIVLYLVLGRIVFLVCDPAVELNGFQYILYTVFWPVVWSAVIVWKLSQDKFWVDLCNGLLMKVWQVWQWLTVKKGGW